MKSRKGQSGIPNWLMGVLALIGVGAILVGTGAINNPLSAAGGNDGKMTQVDDDGVANLQIKAKDVLASSETFAATSYEVVNSEGIEVASGTLSSSSFTKVSNLDEGNSYTVRVYDDDGSGSDYYVATKEVTTSETGKYVIVDAKKEGSVSLSVKENDGTRDDGTITLNKGETQTVTLELKESTQNAAFNQPAVFTKVSANASAITNVEVKSASMIDSVPDRISSYTDGYDTGISDLVDFQTESVTVEITRSDTNGDSATVKLAVADKTGSENDQGKWVSGYEDSSDADVGAADATTTITVS